MKINFTINVEAKNKELVLIWLQQQLDIDQEVFSPFEPDELIGTINITEILDFQEV